MKQNSNLEFRKIPSLKFLYEIDQSGKYIRNVKSKKYAKTMFDTKIKAYTVKITINNTSKTHRIQDLLNECWTKTTYHITISNNFESHDFTTIKQASEYIASKTNRNQNTIRTKIKQHRKYMYGYKIIFRNVETGHVNLTR